MEYVTRTEEHKYPRVSVIHDWSADEPEIEFTLLHWHRRNNMHSDAQKIDPEVFVDEDRYLQADEVEAEYDLLCSWPLYLYEHGGTALSVGQGFSCPWDSGQVGIVGMTKEQWESFWPSDPWTGSEKQLKRALALIEGQIEVLDHYHNGRVYGVVVRPDTDEEEEESCWGFYGLDWDNGMSEYVDEKYHDCLREAMADPEYK